MKVEVLTTPGCTNCSVLEKMLDDFGISYDVIDVTEKPEYLEKYQIRVYWNSKKERIKKKI